MKKLQQICSLALLFLVYFLLFQSAYANRDKIFIDKIIVFGDSLSDNGNMFSLSSKMHHAMPSFPIIPKNPPYFAGRFTNGPVWIENLSHAMNVPLVNYAYGGSWAEPYHDSKQIIPFSLGTQVNFFLVAAATDFAIDQHLFVIWSGANDYTQGRKDPEYATTNTVSHIESQIEWLVYYGAKNFLIINMPDLSYTPEVSAKGPAFAASISQLSRLHNSKMNVMLAKQKQNYPDVKFIFGDVTSYFQDILQSPEKYQLKNVRQACYGGDYSLRSIKMNAREVDAAKKARVDVDHNTTLKTAYLTSMLAIMGQSPCTHPDDYFFWDQIHPTKIIHQLISVLVLSKLNEQDIYGGYPSLRFNSE